jgi:hypothetical protein
MIRKTRNIQYMNNISCNHASSGTWFSVLIKFSGRGLASKAEVRAVVEDIWERVGRPLLLRGVDPLGVRWFLSGLPVLWLSQGKLSDCEGGVVRMVDIRDMSSRFRTCFPEDASVGIDKGRFVVKEAHQYSSRGPHGLIDGIGLVH